MKHTILQRLFSIVLILVFLLGAFQPAPRAAAAPRTDALLDTTPPPPDDGLTYGYHAETGQVSFIGGDAETPLLGEAGALADADAGRAVLAHYAPQFGVRAPAEELALERAETGAAGTALRYRQSYQGVPVLGGELVVGRDNQGRVLSLSGEVSPELELASVTPSVSAEQAAQIALDGMQSWYDLTPEQFIAGEPELWIYDERLFKPSIRPVALVWRLEVRAVESTQPVNELVLVDAASGKIALHFNQIDASWKAQEQEATPEPEVTEEPTAEPTAEPTMEPTLEPTAEPTLEPTPEVTPEAETPEPTEEPFAAMAEGVWYVSTLGSDANDCAAPAAPCATINGAIAKAAAGDTIRVAVGSYPSGVSQVNPAVTISKDVVLLGGWNEEFTSNTGFSTIDGLYSHRGVVVNANVTATIARFMITKAVASYQSYGGAVLANENSSLTLRDCSIHNNQGYVGVGVASWHGKELTIINSTIGQVHVGEKGAGIYAVETGLVNLNNVTIANNSYGSPGREGMGIYFDATTTDVSHTLILKNTIIANNYAKSNPDCSINTANITVISQGNNLIENPVGCGLTPLESDIIEQDARLGLFSPAGYFPLAPSSPAIDAGSADTPGSSESACEAVDQLGRARPLDGNGDGSARCDIGAYEADIPEPSKPWFLSRVSQNYHTIRSNSPDKPLAVFIRDQYGLPLAGVKMQFSAPTSGPSGIFADTGTNETVSSTDINGVATSSIYTPNGSIGSYDIIVSAVGVPYTLRIDFDYTNYPDTVLVQIIKGNNQFRGRQKPFVIPLQVSVKDWFGWSLPGQRVTFTAPEIGPSGIFADTGTNTTVVVADAQGIATAPAFTANDILGEYEVSVLTDKAANPIKIKLTNMELFVSPDGDDTENNCRAPETPCKTFSHTVKQMQPGITLNLTGGEYLQTTGTNITNSNVQISGGWNSNFTARDGQTVLRGTSTSAGFSVSYFSIVSIDHITLDGRSRDNVHRNIGFSVQGVLTLTDSTITGTKGALYNSGTTILNNVTISDNVSEDTSAGIHNMNGSVKLTNVTIVNNLFYSTLSDYYMPRAAGGIWNSASATTELTNTIVANNYGTRGRDCLGKIISHGHNIIGIADGCELSPAEGDIFGTTDAPVWPLVAEAAYNGGNSNTVALLEDSPAIDTGDPAACPATDQRGAARPDGAGCDIGAFEGAGTGSERIPALIYSASNESIYPGTMRCTDLQPSCTNGMDSDADQALQLSLGTHKLYYDQHQRISLDNAGMPLISTVHYGSEYKNAVWTGSQMVYGDGYPQADDVVAHELTHGVTQFESNLLYYYQSGAISESLSDLWGEFYDQTNGLGNDAAGVTWLIGEDLPGGASRSMANPPAYGDPDKMTSTLYFRGWQDNGGVHYNSGVNNKAVYLMVQGGVFNGKTVAPLAPTLPESWAKVAAIYYHAQTNLLTSGSDYADLYNAIKQSCTVLAAEGIKGIQSADCKQVIYALDAVQMKASPTATFNPEAPFCPTGLTKTPANLFFDDFENGDGQWQFEALRGQPRWSIVPGTEQIQYATSGEYALYGNDYHDFDDFYDQDSNTYAAMINGVPIPVGSPVFLHFNQAYGFESGVIGTTTYYFDGGVLEYSTNNGTSWADAKALFSGGQNYKGTLYYGTYNGYNRLRGRAAFVGDSHGYVSSRYNLTSLAGKTVRFRWHMGTDKHGHALGWAVDDVAVYTCVGNPAVPVPAAPANSGLVTPYLPKLNWADAAYASRYTVEVATDSAFTSLVMPAAEVTISEFVPPEPLAPNTRYYWRVRATNSIDVQSAWSPVWSFRTSLIRPTVTAPVSGSHLKLLRPVFTWTESPGAVSYSLVVSTYSNYTTPVINATILATAADPLTYTHTKDLPAGKKLYARLRANGANTSAWFPFVFTTPLPPSVPVLVKPIGNTLVVGSGAPVIYQPTLTWKASTVAAGASPFDHYELQVSETADFSTLLYPSETVDTGNLKTTSFKIPVSLPDNHRYYWRVRALNLAGDPSSWAASSFRTAILKPVQAAPVNNDLSLKILRPEFSWTPSEGAISYTLVVSTYSTLATPVITTTVTEPTFTPTKDLPAGKVVYWRVRANGPNGPSSWSLTWKFTTPLPPAAPVLVSPAANALYMGSGTPIVYQPTLTWKAVTVPAGASPITHYQLEISDQADFSSLLYPNESADTSHLLTSSFKLPVSLPENQKVYWRVRAFNQKGDDGSWTASSFRTAIRKPELTAPVNNDLSLKILRPEFSWSSSEGAVSYTLVVSAYATLATPVINTTVPTTTFTPAADLPAGKVLYWRVRANGPNGPSLWPLPWKFTTPLPPATPVLTAPAANALLTNTAVPPVYKPTLTWKAVTVPVGASPITHYELEVSDAADFSSLLYPNAGADTTHLLTPSFALPVSLPDNLTVYWRVRAYNQKGDAGSWGASSFRTALLKPEPVSPANSTAPVDPLPPVFEWSQPAGAVSYTLVVSTSSTLATPLINTTVSALPYTPTVDLPGGKTYYWRVRANGPNGPSLWSTTWSFTTPTPPSKPVLVSPAANALLTSTAVPPVYTPTLTWNPAVLPVGGSPISHYQLEVSTLANYSTRLYPNETVDTGHLTGTSFAIPVSLPDSMTIYWRVRAVDQKNQPGPWAASYFRTAMRAPLLLNPANNPTVPINDLRPTFRWEKIPGATSYTIVISLYSNMASPFVNSSASINAAVLGTDLPTGKVIYWRVRANGPSGSSPWSQTFAFRAK